MSYLLVDVYVVVDDDVGVRGLGGKVVVNWQLLFFLTWWLDHVI